MTKVKQIEPDRKTAVYSTLPGLSVKSKIEINKYLERYLPYIVESVRIQLGYNKLLSNASSEEASDLVQETLIALWRKLSSERGQINSPKAYIRRVVHSHFLDEIRRRKPTFPLPVNQEGELYLGRVLLVPAEGANDPADEFEHEELIAEVIDDVLRLPPHQQYAMICTLKDAVGDSLALEETFRKRGIDIRKIVWPREAIEMQKLRASLSAARKKLRSVQNKYDFVKSRASVRSSSRGK